MNKLDLYGNEIVLSNKKVVQILHKLSESPNCQIYKTKSDTIIKFIPLTSQSQIAYLNRELKAYVLAGPHPHILSLLDYKIDQPREWSALHFEYLPEGDLNYKLATGTISSDFVKQVGLQLCEALELIHSKGIYHLDIRPENVLVEGKNVKLADFGSAVRDELLTGTCETLANFVQKHTNELFRAPELLDVYSGYKVGPHTDVWQLGCLLYKLLYSELPFPRNTNNQAKGLYTQKDSEGVWNLLFSRVFVVEPQNRATVAEVKSILLEDSEESPQGVSKQLFETRGFSVPDAPRESPREAIFVPSFKASPTKQNFFGKMFNFSTKKNIKKATSETQNPPESNCIDNLIHKAQQKPYKIVKYYQCMHERPVEKTAVALKVLLVEYKYLSSGVLYVERGAEELISSVYSTWHGAKLDSDQGLYFAGLVKKLCEITAFKLKVHTKTCSKGNWSDAQVEGIKTIKSLLTYWRKLIILMKGLLLEEVFSLQQIRLAIAKQLLEEVHSLSQLLVEPVNYNAEVKALTLMTYKQYYDKTLVLLEQLRLAFAELPHFPKSLPEIISKSKTLSVN